MLSTSLQQRFGRMTREGTRASDTVYEKMA